MTDTAARLAEARELRLMAKAAKSKQFKRTSVAKRANNQKGN